MLDNPIGDVGINDGTLSPVDHACPWFSVFLGLWLHTMEYTQDMVRKVPDKARMRRF